MESNKILFVDHTAVLGGAELALNDLAVALRDRTSVLLFEDGPLRQLLENQEVRVNVIEAGKQILKIKASTKLASLTTIPQIFSLAQKIAENSSKFDVLIANSQKAFVISALATLYGTPPLIWYLHDIVTAKHFSWFNRRLVIFLANRLATKVIVNSQATANAFQSAGGNPKLVEIVLNGLSFQPFDRVTSASEANIRSQLNLENVFLVGLFSRLSYWKGQHILLDAVKELPHIHVLFVGDSLFKEDEYVSSLKTQADVPELAGRVHWLGFRHDIPALMKSCDLVVHTSTEPEPFGRVIVEGQLARKPVIASAAGGALEIIEDRINGCLFPPGNSEALGKLISELAGDRNLRSTLGQQGYKNAKENFTFEVMQRRFEQVISTV